MCLCMMERRIQAHFTALDTVFACFDTARHSTHFFAVSNALFAIFYALSYNTLVQHIYVYILFLYFLVSYYVPFLIMSACPFCISSSMLPVSFVVCALNSSGSCFDPVTIFGTMVSAKGLDAVTV